MIDIAIIFSRNKKIGSKIISYFTSHLNKTNLPTPSHVALLVNGRWICESTLEKGVHIISIDKWSAVNEIVYIKPFKSIIFSDIKDELKKIVNKKYDWLGVIYFAICILLHRYFHISIPIKNLWHSDNKYFCTEVLRTIFPDKTFSMCAPVQILNEMADNLN